MRSAGLAEARSSPDIRLDSSGSCLLEVYLRFGVWLYEYGAYTLSLFVYYTVCGPLIFLMLSHVLFLVLAQRVIWMGGWLSDFAPW